jgi:hypothetical protein
VASSYKGMSRKNRPHPTRLTRVLAIIIGILVLLWVYYDPFQKSLYHSYVMGKVLGLGLVLTLGTIWFWLHPYKWH